MSWLLRERLCKTLSRDQSGSWTSNLESESRLQNWHISKIRLLAAILESEDVSDKGRSNFYCDTGSIGRSARGPSLCDLRSYSPRSRVREFCSAALRLNREGRGDQGVFLLKDKG